MHYYHGYKDIWKFKNLNFLGFKEVTKIVALPDKPSVVALIDVEKAVILFYLTWYLNISKIGMGNLLSKKRGNNNTKNREIII